MHKLLGSLGPKLHFYRLPRIEESEDDYFIQEMRIAVKKGRMRTALLEYLHYFDKSGCRYSSGIRDYKQNPFDQVFLRKLRLNRINVIPLTKYFFIRRYNFQ
jgi:hypothetical protein